MSRTGSTISFCSDSESSSDEDVAPPPVSPILAPTPTIAEKLKKANADLLNYESPPNSRNSRIGFHEEPRIIEYKSDPDSPVVPRHRTPQPPSPLAQEPSPTINEDNYSDDSDHEEDSDSKNDKSSNEEESTEAKPEENPEAETVPLAPQESNDQSEAKVDEKQNTVSSTDANEAEIEKQEPEPEVEEPEPEVKEVEVSMSSLVVEENGKFSVSQSPRESVSSVASSQTNRSKKNDVNPDYRSPYALSDDQKKRLRKRERAKQRKLREDAEAERIQKQEAEEEQESAYQAWLEQKKEERKERRAESRKTGSNHTQNDSCGDADTVAWEDWLKEKRKQVKQRRIIEHQNEIERMEGLYVRSRQENDKAFRAWLREKRRQAEFEREEQWHQVKMARAELRQIRANQKRAAIIHAAHVAQALDFI